MSNIISDLNPHHFNLDMSDYDKKTAIFCAQLSEIAYWNPKRINNLIEELSNHYPSSILKHKFIEDRKSGTQLLFFGTKSFVVVAFRGTNSSKIINDTLLVLKLSRYYINFGFSEHPKNHDILRNGIMKLTNSGTIFSELENFICTINPQLGKQLPIYTTGHSFGAALATMLIEPLTHEGFNFKGSYNFAPPLVISKPNAKALSEKYGSNVYDIVNYLDYLPRAGQVSRKYLARIGKFYRICKSGIIHKEEEKRNGKYLSHPWKTKFMLYKYHKMSGYINGLKHPENSNQKILERKKLNKTCI